MCVVVRSHVRCCQAVDLDPVARELARKLFFFNDTATTEIYTFSLHDALPILAIAFAVAIREARVARIEGEAAERRFDLRSEEHTSDSSHVSISYAVFCLKKKTG